MHVLVCVGGGASLRGYGGTLADGFAVFTPCFQGGLWLKNETAGGEGYRCHTGTCMGPAPDASHRRPTAGLWPQPVGHIWLLNKLETYPYFVPRKRRKQIWWPHISIFLRPRLRCSLKITSFFFTRIEDNISDRFPRNNVFKTWCEIYWVSCTDLVERIAGLLAACIRHQPRHGSVLISESSPTLGCHHQICICH